ncbi:cell division topological specificity factor [Natranaerovirga hydrolytica]|uniref:Cell division topological specificity factor n=1 Tax=Natranaerovirga hydrolytica TaxID=680378 RepID=A0A4R1MZT3_9FIRM|nr:cell division topological specificity factor MinE [Natranaerovirga hydrolytica]TCK98092.1 cell division topological specificity factor [Natranaerovirga hydrolytica]
MSLSNLLNRKSSSSTAKDRLKLLLIHDRANCSPEVLEMLKSDIINVISDYMEIDKEGLEFEITQTQSDSSDASVPALYANIPIKSMRSMYKK